ncbi:MAG: proline--tRNA ligase [Fervidicoccaceae archaeon]
MGDKFNEWFDRVLREAEIYDYGRYPIKGVGIWMPYGYALRKNILDVVRRELDSTGHEEVLFPMLIPEDLLVKEEEHIRGFRDEVYWVTHGGLEELDVKLALRPTSETSISYMESLWFNSYKQLPRKFYQIVSIFRYETKSTRPLLRLREVTTFKEAHTAHSSFEDADRQVKEALDIYSRIFDSLGIPYIISRRPDFDKFAGALYTIAFDTVFPDGRALQIGTVHHLGQSFSKPIDVKVMLSDESIDYVWQTSYGISDRVIASVIAVHGDERGAVLPFRIAPLQVSIVPIYFNEEEKASSLRYAREIEGKLKDCGIRAKIDEREELTPGKKFYDLELRGIPIRAEIGRREVAGRTAVLARRDLLKKVVVEADRICEEVIRIGDEIDRNLKERAWTRLNSSIRRVISLQEIENYEERKGIVETPWCGKDDCALKMQEKTGLKALGSPIDPPDWVAGKKCPICGREAKTSLRLARTY